MSLLDKPVLFKDPDYNKKILLFDLETAPNIGAYFELYREGNIVWNEEHWYILSVAYKWLGEKETYVIGLPDFKGYRKDKSNDGKLVQELWKLFNTAEVIIAHNGDQFDIKKTNARFLYHHLEPPAPYKTIDTKKLAKRDFKFDSNKLDDLADYLGIGRKLRTEKGLWKDCMEGDLKAWEFMKEYNKQDVILLEKVYYKLRAWSKTGPNLNLILGGIENCPRCHSLHIQKAGMDYTAVGTYQSYRCLNCGSRPRGERIKRETPIR
jgi:hypothetical protein